MKPRIKNAPLPKEIKKLIALEHIEKAKQHMDRHLVIFEECLRAYVGTPLKYPKWSNKNYVDQAVRATRWWKTNTNPITNADLVNLYNNWQEAKKTYDEMVDK